jgi:hypothetical protein
MWQGLSWPEVYRSVPESLSVVLILCYQKILGIRDLGYLVEPSLIDHEVEHMPMT